MKNKPKSSAIDLSIIIPAFREAARIGTTLDELSKYLKEDSQWGSVEVIVITAEDTDGTVKAANELRKEFDNFKIIELAERAGKGRDVRHGMLAAKGRYRLFMDADLATPLHHLKAVYEQSIKQRPVIIGVRNLNQTHTGLRKFISEFGNILVRIMLNIHIQDTQCGFKAFRSDVAHDLFSKQTIDGWGFDMEILAIAKKTGHSITALELDDWRDVEGGTFNNVAVSGALSTFRDLLLIKWNLIRGKYN